MLPPNARRNIPEPSLRRLVKCSAFFSASDDRNRLRAAIEAVDIAALRANGGLPGLLAAFHFAPAVPRQGMEWRPAYDVPAGSDAGASAKTVLCVFVSPEVARGVTVVGLRKEMAQAIAPGTQRAAHQPLHTFLTEAEVAARPYLRFLHQPAPRNGRAAVTLRTTVTVQQRLYAAVLSPQAHIPVDWLACRNAVADRAGTIVPEVDVAAAWLAFVDGAEQRRRGDVGAEQPQRAVAHATAPLPPAVGARDAEAVRPAAAAAQRRRGREGEDGDGAAVARQPAGPMRGISVGTMSATVPFTFSPGALPEDALALKARVEASIFLDMVPPRAVGETDDDAWGEGSPRGSTDVSLFSAASREAGSVTSAEVERARAFLVNLSSPEIRCLLSIFRSF